MKEIHQNKGFTLVEILVSLTILTILAVAFTAFFSWNAFSIFKAGDQSRAVAKAEEKLEKLHFSIENYASDLEYEECQDVYTYYARERNFCVDEVDYVDGKVEGCKVTVVVFYQNGERYVSISSFIGGY